MADEGWAVLAIIAGGSLLFGGWIVWVLHRAYYDPSNRRDR